MAGGPLLREPWAQSDQAKKLHYDQSNLLFLLIYKSHLWGVGGLSKGSTEASCRQEMSMARCAGVMRWLNTLMTIIYFCCHPSLCFPSVAAL